MRAPVRFRALAAIVAAGVLTLVSAGPVGAAPVLDVVDIAVGADRQVSAVVAAPAELGAADIPAGAFTAFENGQPRPVAVARLPHDSLEVVLVIDTSGSMKGAAMTAAKAAATAFINQMPPDTRIGLIAFGDTARVASPFTTDRAALAAAVKGLAPKGETALYDALVATAAQFSGEGATRRSVVLLSDGGDTVSKASLDDTLARLSTQQAEFFAVALPTSESDSVALGRLAEAARGHVVPANDPDQLAATYRAIASRLVHRYQLRLPAETAGRSEFRIALDHGGVHAEVLRNLDVPAAPTPAPTEGVPTPQKAPSPGLFQRAWMLPVGALAFGAALAVAGWHLGSSAQPRRRQVLAFARSARPAASEHLSGLSKRAAAMATAAADRLLERRQQTGSLNRALDRAGIAIRPGEFVVLAGTCALSAFALGFLLAGTIAGLGLGAAVAAGFHLAVSRRAQRRQAAFAEQLGDTLALLAGSLRTGYGLIQALDTVARESESPTAEEFRRLVTETRLGRDLSDSLQSLADRVGNEDFDWVTQAIGIHREVGGDLAEVLDKTGETIRDRNRVRRQVRALSAEGRLSAIILFVLPFVVAAFVGLTNPDYLGDLVVRPGGRMLLAAAGALMLVGGIWLRRLVQLRF
jgi:tight adherence protein B